MASTLYQLPDLPAIVRSKSTLAWGKVDVKDIPGQDLFALYREIEIPITDAYGNPFTLKLTDYESDFKYSIITFSQWFDQLTDQALVLTPEYPVLNEVMANYKPITYNTGGKYELAKRGYHPSHNVAAEDYDDVIINYSAVTPQYLHENALWSFGGFFLPTTWHSYGLRVMGAGDLIRKSSDFRAGCLNFEKIGKVTQVPITESMISKVDDTYTYFDSVTINAGTSLTNKTVGIVLGGYLHLLDGFVKVISDRTVKLSMRHLQYIERMLVARKYLDIPGLEIEDVEAYAIPQKLRSDIAGLAYLTSPYSFLVIIDNPNMYLVEKELDRNALLGNFIIPDTENLGLLVDRLGRGLEYWPHWEAGQWSLNTTQSHLPMFNLLTTGWYNESRINDALVGNDPYRAIEPKILNFTARV